MLILFSFLIILNFQITKELRDKNPAFFKNQRIFHSAPKPLFKNRNHTLDFVTDLPSDSIESATLYFKTDSMSYFREFELNFELSEPFHLLNILFNSSFDRTVTTLLDPK